MHHRWSGVGEWEASRGGVTHNSSIATGGVFGGIDPSHFSVSRERERAAWDRIYLSHTHTCLPHSLTRTRTHILAATRGSVPRVITDVNLWTWNPLAVARWYISEKRLLFLLSFCNWLSFLFFLHYADHFPACRRECVKENRLTREKSYLYEVGGSSLAHFYHIWKERNSHFSFSKDHSWIKVLHINSDIFSFCQHSHPHEEIVYANWFND